MIEKTIVNRMNFFLLRLMEKTIAMMNATVVIKSKVENGCRKYEIRTTKIAPIAEPDKFEK